MFTKNDAKNEKITNKINGKYWSSHVHWKNLSLYSVSSVDKSLLNILFFFALLTALLI